MLYDILIMDIHVSYYIEKTEELVMQKKNRHRFLK